MKTRNGRPTKAEIIALCEKHNLLVHQMDSYVSRGVIAYSSDRQIPAAMKVYEDLVAAGFPVEHRHAESAALLNGTIRIGKKVD